MFYIHHSYGPTFLYQQYNRNCDYSLHLDKNNSNLAFKAYRNFTIYSTLHLFFNDKNYVDTIINDVNSSKYTKPKDIVEFEKWLKESITKLNNYKVFL